MSELIDNRRERRETLKKIIRDIHTNKDPEELKQRFKQLLGDVGATEIAELEQELIKEGMPEAEIKSLCDVHVSVFKEGLDKRDKSDEKGGHPVHTFKKENRAVEQVIAKIQQLFIEFPKVPSEKSADFVVQWLKLHEQLMEIEKHYSRKENILFPYLEKHGVTGPPKVMWSIHDDIRAQLKHVRNQLQNKPVGNQELQSLIESVAKPVLKAIEEMIYKEENILFPMCMETLTEGEWAAVLEQGEEIGYTLVKPDKGWIFNSPAEPIAQSKYKLEGKTEVTPGTEMLTFETGVLTSEQISSIFNHLPVDITFVDKDNVVKYFSQGKERIFQRSKAIIGRQVENCHPPDSVHIVNKIVEDFRSGRRDSADFWIKMNGMYVYIQYFAVRDKAGNYQGTIEVTQDIEKIQQIQGEKRIYSEE